MGRERLLAVWERETWGIAGLRPHNFSFWQKMECRDKNLHSNPINLPIWGKAGDFLGEIR